MENTSAVGGLVFIVAVRGYQDRVIMARGAESREDIMSLMTSPS